MKNPIFIISLVIPLLMSCFLGPNTDKLYRKNLQNRPFDAIIVPGIPYDDVQYKDVMKIRVYWAKYLFDKGIAKNVIFSGGAVYTPYVESRAMALYAQQIGIPKEAIFTETNAEHSTENLYFSYQLGKSLGFKKMAVASDPWQSKWLYKFAKKKRIPVASLPMNFDTLKRIKKEDPQINAEEVFVKDFVSIVERKTFFERLRGTRGKDIIFED